MRGTERVADILACQREVSSAERTLTEASAKCLWEQIKRKHDVSSFIRSGRRYPDRSSDKLKWDRGLFRLRFCICKSEGFFVFCCFICSGGKIEFIENELQSYILRRKQYV